MENYGLTSVSAFLGDMLVYRNLEPMDSRLPAFDQIAPCLGIRQGDGPRTPRKTEADYARVMAYLLRYARALTTDKEPIERLIYVGDTQLNDGTAFANLCTAGGWPGLAFIGSETPDPAAVRTVNRSPGTLYLANRWAMLEDFEAYCAAKEFPLDVHTAVILDLDKTTLGARGRNDHVINEARVAAVRDTVAGMLGADFDAEEFRTAYDKLNQTEFHPFTTDNQDYLAYLCLIIGSGLFSLATVVDQIRSGELAEFSQFLADVEANSKALPERLRALHEDIYERVRDGDPTPFKAFRRQEYLTTIRRMGHLPGDAEPADLLASEIVITQEVREIALRWRDQGVLLFGLSDKPDEASIPTQALADQGYEAIHRTQTHAVGTTETEGQI
ncbi:MAG: hypothetical protein ACP5JG_08080 [Anaerolineae bacterium]